MEMKTPTLKARDLLKIQPLDMIDMFPKGVNLVYDDGETHYSTGRKLVWSRFIWEHHIKFPHTPLLYRHHVDYTLKGNPMNGDTQSTIDSILMRDVFEAYEKAHGSVPRTLTEEFTATAYDIANQLEMEIRELAESSLVCNDIVDILELAEDPYIKQLRSETEATADSIQNTYVKGQEFIMKSSEYKDNTLVRSIRAKAINVNQLNQCIFMRGFTSEVNGYISANPVMSNYILGMNTLFDFSSDSRSASKALYSAESPLQAAEYFARRLQMLAIVVEKIEGEDCGSEEYISWYMNKPSYDQYGRTLYQGDLAYMKGKMILDEETGLLHELTGKETHLYGKVVKMRSVLKCKNDNPHSVCKTCYGGMYRNVSRFANLGHLSGATLTQQSSQKTLGTKHLTANAMATVFELTSDGKKFFVNEPKDPYIYLNPRIVKESIKLKIQKEHAIGLIDLMLVDDINNISPNRVSAIEFVEVTQLERGIEVPYHIPLMVTKHPSMFTVQFMEFIKGMEREVSPDGHFIFKLDNWDITQPIFKLPEMETSFADHSDMVAEKIESTSKDLKNRATPEAPSRVLQELAQLTNSKLFVNLVCLEVLVYAAMTPSANEYGMARHAKNPGLNVAEFIIKNRSLGLAYQYEAQSETILNPRSFFPLDRPSSIMDVFMAPQETVEDRKDLFRKEVDFY